MLSASLRIKEWISTKRSMIPIKKQILFLHRVRKLLGKGFPLLDTLKMISWDPEFEEVTVIITQQLKTGNPLDIAFDKAHFSKQIVSFLYFARIHHDLPTMFKQCADLLELQYEYTRKFKEAMRYPLLLLIFVIVAFSVIKQTIIPSFQTLFADGDTKPFSLMILNGVDILITISGLLLLILALTFLVFYSVKHKITLQQMLTLYEKIPLLKHYKMFSLTFLFSTHLSSLLAAGLPLKNALTLISEQSRYPFLSYYGKRMLSHLSDGQSLASSLNECTLLRSELTSIFHHTNDLRALGEELNVLSELLIDQLKEKLTKIVQLIQPIFFIGVACVVILIYASIMLPLYQWMDQI
ncbi:competence type IV pilus assembly protein ComGB [Halobacillus campisalis]|uniref:Competence type IV pilus assembly protein ComGB n=1 Tax=Halobacillus campisalis TaxID=435909 RepID=A0ABW2K487_9BACI|nr:competence type IV pilus assembly protein ComGB [Halobacillus campisalis]